MTRTFLTLAFTTLGAVGFVNTGDGLGLLLVLICPWIAYLNWLEDNDL